MKQNNRWSTLDPDQISITIERLAQRIHERFPDSGLYAVCLQLLEISRRAKAEATWIAQPVLPLRFAVSTLLAVLIALLFITFWWLQKPTRPMNAADVVQLFESVVNDLIFIGLTILFLTSIETRLKRRRALRALHELRAVAHIIDMHQLTKDPDRVLEPGKSTQSSPVHDLDKFKLGRYLDYCSEMLALTGKIAALYVQRLDDATVLAAVNEIEALAAALSSKIWQKIMLLHSIGEES